MTSTWKKCFLCLSDLSSVGRKRKRKRSNVSQVNLEIMLKYLLPTNKDDNHLFQSILQLQSCETDAGDPVVKLCERCGSAKQRISELHRQLEVVQMKLIDSIGSVRKTIIQASEQGGRLEGNRAKTSPANDVFEGASKRVNAKANSSMFQNVLRAFQNVVQERDKDCAKVPFVYLERCLAYKSPPPAQNQKGQESVMIKDLLVKTEQETCPLENINDDELPEVDFKMEPFCSDPLFVSDDKDETYVPSKVKPRKRKRKAAKSLLPRTPTKKRKMTVVTSKIETEPARNLPFACKMCPYQLRKYQSFRIEHHLRQHETTEKNYKCPHCPAHEGFTGEQLFQLHLTYHKISTGMTCPYCNKKILKIEMGDHYRSHGDQVFQCEGCAYSTTSQAKFLKHVESFRAKTEKLKCYICQEEFAFRKRLLTHLHQVHKAIQKRVCDFEGCGRIFLSEVKLMAHRRLHNSISLMCQECGKIFTSGQNLEAHQLLHTGELPFPCDQCSQGFRSKLSLDTHKMREHFAPKFKCSECDNEYTTSTYLRSHVEAVHQGMRYPCEYCEKTYNTPAHLRRHTQRHTGHDGLVCEVCKKVFTMRDSLRKHMLIHTGEKNFVCSYCKKSFTYAKYLKAHLRIHTGDKPFLCVYCGKAFNQVAGLYLHKKSQHLKEFELERLAKK